MLLLEDYLVVDRKMDLTIDDLNRDEEQPSLNFRIHRRKVFILFGCVFTSEIDLINR